MGENIDRKVDRKAQTVFAYSKLTIQTLEGRHWRCYGVFTVNLEQISNLFLVFLPLTMNK